MDYDEFFKAVKEGNQSKVKEFIGAGIDVNKVDSESGRCALHMAIYLDRIHVVHELLKAKDIDVNVQDEDKDTPLHYAIRSSHIIYLKNLLKVDGLNPNIQNNDGNAPIHLSLSIDGRLPEFILLLKDERVDVNLSNNTDTPLIYAIKGYGLMHQVLEILKHPDIDVEKKDKLGNTPLRYAVNRARLDIVKALLGKGANVDGPSKDGVTPLHEAILSKTLGIFLELLNKNASIESKITEENITPLIAACTAQYPNMILALLERGANPNAKTTTGMTPLYICCNYGLLASVKELLKKGADPNIAVIRGRFTGRTPLYNACKGGFIDIVKVLLEIPKGPQAIDKDSGASKQVLREAKEGKFYPGIRNLILEFFKEPGPGDEPWKGWTRSDAEAMDAIFGAIEPHKNFPENERYAFVPLDDITYCPICLAYTPRLGKAGETKGCMYMYHDCTKTAGVVYHEGLYAKYKSDDGLIWWCTICNRIAKGHQHYALAPPDVEGDLPRVLKATGSPFDKSCKPGHGGGGVEEKIRRFMRLRELAKELTGEKLTRQEAVNTLVEEMWTAGLTERRDAKRVAAALEAKEFPNRAANFPANRANAPVANRNYPNITRSAANLAELKPVISRDVEKWDSIELEYLKPAILFNHREPPTAANAQGKIVKHKPGKEDGDDGEWLGFKTIQERIEYYVKNYSAEDFAACPITGCKAKLYPDEIQEVVPKELYEEYRKAFNKRFPEGVKGGGKKRFTRRQRKQKGGAFKGIFRVLDDAKCVRPWKTGR